ncbi:MAG: response regulator transcription factor [Oscillospiraceae bacterium]|mgnify:CR=1 FL=1|jgi:two-component system alkaline phosphatase synthesis response regulator PhoP|nr:response regulator transcription factor [Oscillospiraceae bacterium]
MIFCVEDDSGIRDLMVYALNAAGLEAAGFDSGASLEDALRERRPSLILLDIMLPGQDGLSILKKLRARTDTADIPIIMATAKGTEFDRVTGLDLGADDYLSKPFGMMEMMSRVRAVLRRAGPKAPPQALRTGGLELDLEGCAAYVDGARSALTRKEYLLLRTLMERPGRVFTRGQLLEAVWGTDHMGETRTVDVHIATLRTKLGEYGRQIETVRGLGYRMEGDR